MPEQITYLMTKGMKNEALDDYCRGWPSRNAWSVPLSY
ncbi:hypothetical protein NBRC3293_2843 [Gluconobacter oxydans NBRC 3293]|uniref:Uncharacterized protein n=1 Tax=Gluconobacter oxydans NBRC 3293 TaxID=1315969 RepID=A0A829XDB9_GLUOY|nr:hypothetical protein NBRC3293_2843 [Gluconobacter oxydans NBRC 3293]